MFNCFKQYQVKSYQNMFLVVTCKPLAYMVHMVFRSPDNVQIKNASIILIYSSNRIE